MKKEIALKILAENKEVYNRIAYDFSSTRSHLWQDILPLLDYTKKQAKALDLGCGNGRLYPPLKEKQADYTGTDNSEELIKIAQEKYKEARFVVTEGLKLPFHDNSFDIVYCIAVLHHLPSKELRIKFLEEARRVLRPKGLMIATVWKLGLKDTLYFYCKTLFEKAFLKSELDFGDGFKSWQNKEKRYVHNFRKRELRKLFQTAGFKIKKAEVLNRERGKNKKMNYNLALVASKEN